MIERIALCGGTFDPFHLGHLHAPLSVAAPMGWSRIVFIPARRQPFKLDKSTSSPYHRHAMLVLATEEREEADVSLFELERDETSFTVDTLEYFRDLYPSAVLDWVIGDDNVELLPKWRSLERIFELANFVVLARDEEQDLPAAVAGRRAAFGEKPRNGAIIFAPNKAMKVSSTDIRAMARRGETFDSMVHPRVAHYIRKHRLYSDDGEIN